MKVKEEINGSGYFHSPTNELWVTMKNVSRFRLDASHIQTVCSSLVEEYLPYIGNNFQDKINIESRLITGLLYELELTPEFELSKSSTPDPNSSSISVSVP
jgi:hypothetical protein